MGVNFIRLPASFLWSLLPTIRTSRCAYFMKRKMYYIIYKVYIDEITTPHMFRNNRRYKLHRGVFYFVPQHLFDNEPKKNKNQHVLN